MGGDSVSGGEEEGRVRGGGGVGAGRGWVGEKGRRANCRWQWC